MFQTIRRRDREIGRPETEELLRRGKYGVLSMNGTDGYAYGVPMNYVYTDGGIYLHCAAQGKKLAHIRNDNKVSFCIVGEAEALPDQFSMKYTSAIVFGTASEVDGDQEKLAALVALVEKYGTTAEYIDKGRIYAANSLHTTAVLRIKIEHTTGKARK